MDINFLLQAIVDSEYGAYYLAVTALLGSFVLVASSLVKFTKTTKDDEVVGYITAIVQRLSVIKPRAPKE